MRSLAFASVLLFSLAVACGGNDKPPASSGGGGTRVVPEQDGGGDMTKIDEAAWADAGLTIPDDAGSSSTASKPPATPPPVDTDECTPVGVDFEKRARPDLKACYAQGKKKDPNLEGTVRLTVSIDGKGAVKNIKIVEKTLPDPVAQCMLKVLKKTPFPEAKKCPDKNITIPMTFPTPH
jgi:hypothetical protein